MRNISKLMQLHVVWHIHQFQVFLWHSMSSICHVFNTYFFLTQLFNNFFFFAICKIWLHSWYHLIRVWRTLEVFGDGRHFDFLLQLCCLFWFWSFTSNMESTEIRIFECSSRGMRQWEKNMKPLHCKTVLDAHCSRDSFIDSFNENGVIFYHTYWFT